ncbi:MAG: glycine dehydrogenase (aminomethyl-transferring), partial [Myxococcota bacterium]|nr:glycine dehydrogenase (aminomethyl-transferring) [Myxococcota bacterium]
MPASEECRSTFEHRHVGPSPADVRTMLTALGLASTSDLVEATIPAHIRSSRTLDLPSALSERQALERLRELAAANQEFRSYLGMGYHGCLVPGVIQRNVLENPGWYTAYTPYQSEIAQGRLEALLVFQTMVSDLTGMETANASLLDEATAAAEAMTMSLRLTRNRALKAAPTFFVSSDCHPQTLAILRTRAVPMGIRLVEGSPDTFDFNPPVFGALLQDPTTDGRVEDYRNFCDRAHEQGTLVTVATDLLSLTLLTPPAEFGADIAVGSSQRLGVPMGYGGPHAAFLATRSDYRRQVPGRIIGVSQDARGRTAYRMALQTREQHIRRERATSNICTAQVLLAVMAAMYTVYHGPGGLARIARGIHRRARQLAAGLRRAGHRVSDRPFFDTVAVSVDSAADVLTSAREANINLRALDDRTVCICLDETAPPWIGRRVWVESGVGV